MCSIPQVGEPTDIDGGGSPRVMAWSEVLPVLRAELPKHEIQRYFYEEARKGLRKAPPELRDELHALFDAWLTSRWPGWRAAVVDEATVCIGGGSYSGTSLGDLLEWYPPLRSDPTLVRNAIDRLDRTRDRSSGLSDLPQLRGSDADAAVLIDRSLLRHWSDAPDDLADTLLAWLPGVRGELMHALWKTDPDESSHSTSAVAMVARALRQLPIRAGGPLDPFTLGEMSSATRASWRRSLAEIVAGDAGLRQATTEALLWLAAHREDLFAQYTALEINLPDPQPVIDALLSHPSPLVAARARSALDGWAGVTDPMEPFLTRIPPTVAASPTEGRPSRTWLADRRLEDLLKTTFTDACASFAAKVHNTASSGEENLVGRLLERLEVKCESITERAAKLARHSDATKRLEVSLRHRVIGKKEEGSPGLLEDGKFSTDVALVLRARLGDAPPFGERATFIQAKRVRRGAGLELDHFEVEIGQLQDLVAQTASGFVLAIAPETLGVTLPVAPAGLLLAQYGGVKVRTLHPDALARSGRSLADWLVDDVIGMWTGDPRPAAVEKAMSGHGDRATVLVELDVALVPVPKDD